MASWAEFEQAAQGLAANVQACFRSYRHCLLATLRADGSPRLNGIEVQFTQGHLWMGMMSGSMKARDLQRDGRMALHSVLDTPEVPVGDAKLGGRATEITDRPTIDAWAASLGNEPPGTFHLFRVDVAEASHLRAEGDHLVIEWWDEGTGYHSVNRQ